MVSIIDYGMGNLSSIKKTLDFLKIDSVITDNIDVIQNSKLILLPGVGSFEQGMKNLKNKGLDKILTEEVLNKKKPFLGICLGMQLIAQKGFEPNECSGLGWIEGEVLKIQEKELRIPHLGWNSIETNQDSYLFDYNNKDFYFIHSYHFKLKEENKIAAWVNYGSKYVAAIKSENIFATQFHPEKSQEIGLNMIEKFIKENVKN